MQLLQVALSCVVCLLALSYNACMQIAILLRGQDLLQSGTMPVSSII